MKPVTTCALKFASDTGAKLAVPARLCWVTAAKDWQFVDEWQQLAERTKDQNHIDSAEYGAIAGQRWRYLRDRGECALSPEDARHRASAYPHDEYGFALLMQLPEGRSWHTVGFCHVRRLWSGNLCLEYLGAVAPKGCAGVGQQMLAWLAQIACSTKAGEIWGECTLSSRGFYQRVKSGLLISKLEADLLAKSFTLAGWQLPGAIDDRFSFAGHELKLLSDLRKEHGSQASEPST